MKDPSTKHATPHPCPATSVSIGSGKFTKFTRCRLNDFRPAAWVSDFMRHQSSRKPVPDDRWHGLCIVGVPIKCCETWRSRLLETPAVFGMAPLQEREIMVTREELVGNWNQVKGRLKEHWGQLSDDELTRLRGRADDLVGFLQERTGETRGNIEKFLSDVVAEGSSLSHRVSETTGQYAHEAADYLRDGYGYVADASDDFAKRFAHSVRSRPTESILIAFGIGIAAGAFFFMGRKR